MTALLVVWRSLAEGFFMFWDTLWALVLGFGLSGLVQAFVSRGQMRRVMGDHRVATLGRSSVLGAASSSCSYAASALTKSLFARGADFTASMVFMVASTNLVVELGLVLWLLIGWQFTLAEYVGGAIMIALLGLVLPRAVPHRLVDAARDRLNDRAGHPAQHGPDTPAASLRERMHDRDCWADAAGYTIGDLTMLRKELLIGFLAAGFLAVAVPARAWQALFLTGHGFASSLENALLGPLLALLSFVCSVGNVPLAAALWHGGISFGGVVAFVFADLITLPLLLIYRKFYGTAVTLRLLATFWLVMSAAGLAIEYLFSWWGLLPARAPAGPVAATGFSWNYTTFLDIVALIIFAVIYHTYRQRARTGARAAYAKDPVCGMQVEKDNAPATTTHDDHTIFFCSDRCHDRFVADPAAYAPDRTSAPPSDDGGDQPIDPVCGMTVTDADPPNQVYAGRTYRFCSTGCRDAFRQDPLAHLQDAPDPVCKMTVDTTTAAATAEHQGYRYVFCSTGCRDAFEQDADAVLDAARKG